MKCDLEFVLNAPGEGDTHKFVESKRVYNPMLSVSHVHMVYKTNSIYTKFTIIDCEGCFMTSGCDMSLTEGCSTKVKVILVTYPLSKRGPMEVTSVLVSCAQSP